MKSEYTRAEVLAAVAGAYRKEQAEYHRLTEKARAASERGEAALYVLCDEEAEKQRIAVDAVRRVADALYIGEVELNVAANSERPSS